MTDLTFYTTPMSRGRTVRWMLEELGVPYEAVLMDLKSFGADHPYRAINPMLKVPAIVHRGQVVTETAAICAYLAEAFPGAGLAPTEGERAAYYRWMFFAAGPLETACVNSFLGFEAPAEARPMVGYGDMDRVVETLESALSARDYIAGDRFTAADVYMGAQVGWQTGVGMLPKRAAFDAYLERTMARPAGIRARAIDDALIAQAAAA